MKISKKLKSLHKTLHLKEMGLFLRRQRPVTKLLGERFHRSRELIEIDITCDCNLKCFNCDRSCTQAPSNEQMSIDQIGRFVDESIAANVKWKRIRVLGGEPTLHPELIAILQVLKDYHKSHSPSTLIQLVTNGFGRANAGVLARVPAGVLIENSGKKTRAQKFFPFNVAPRDLAWCHWLDYSSGCWITEGCGIGLTLYGYYPCGAAGGIDRVFGFGLGRKSLPDADDSMRDLLRHFCQYCGHFRRFRRTDKARYSPTWEQAYKRYSEARPTLTLY